VDCAERAGLEVIKWDKEETAAGGPFPQILTDCDVFVNCILLQVRCLGELGCSAGGMTRALLGGAVEGVDCLLVCRGAWQVGWIC
jgi:saccharopine dehydrogenase (NAD+, L-lysine-forming)